MRRLWPPAATAPMPATAREAVRPTPQQMTHRPDGFRVPRAVGLVAAAERACSTPPRRSTGTLGDRQAAIHGLRPLVEALAAAPATIRAGVAGQAFADEAKAWLDATVLWAEAMDAALDILSHPPVRAWAGRRRIDSLVAEANDIRPGIQRRTQAQPRVTARSHARQGRRHLSTADHYLLDAVAGGHCDDARTYRRPYPPSAGNRPARER